MHKSILYEPREYLNGVPMSSSLAVGSTAMPENTLWKRKKVAIEGVNVEQ